MKTFKSCVVNIDPFKDKLGRGIRWVLRGEAKIRGLIVVREQFEDGSVKETVTYRQEAGMRPCGLQSDSKQSLQFAWDWFHGKTLCVKRSKDGGIYSKGRIRKDGNVEGSTFAWWEEWDQEKGMYCLCRSNYPDVKGSRRPLFSREVYGWFDERRDVIIVNDLPEFMHKGSGWVYNTQGIADELSEVRRHGGLKK